MIFSFSIRKEKRQSLLKKEREAKFNANDLIFTKKFSLPSGTLLFAECSTTEYKSPAPLIRKYKPFGTKSKQTVIFLNIPKKSFPSTPSKKCVMIEEFKDRIKGLNNILNEIKLRTLDFGLRICFWTSDFALVA